MVGLRRFVWHGDAKSQKQSFVRSPAELLVTTPESLEVMLMSSRVTLTSASGKPSAKKAPFTAAMRPGAPPSRSRSARWRDGHAFPWPLAWHDWPRPGSRAV